MTIFDIIGVGIGPSNLSTAALLNPFGKKVSSIFFDDKKEFNWHPGLMFPDATLQVSFLKDLVTMLDPTNKFSFLNYLREERKLYIFAARNGFNKIKRKEFEDYLKWAVSKLENLNFDSHVQEIKYLNGVFDVRVNDRNYYAKNIVMGAGLTSTIPSFCRPFLSSTLFHSSQFLKHYNNYQAKEITIVGCGQSSCEILKFILKQPWDVLPTAINWIFKNHKLNVMEDTPFANELYTPNYSDYVYSLSSEQRAKVIEEQKFTSDGVSEDTINEIYDLLYHHKFDEKCKVTIYNDSVLTDVTKINSRYSLSINGELSLTSDVVILGTGFFYKIPECIQNLSGNYSTEGGTFSIDQNYRLIPLTPREGDVFIHNGAKHVRGVADPNLSLLAWRSGVIINTLLKHNVYEVRNEKSIIDWSIL